MKNYLEKLENDLIAVLMEAGNEAPEMGTSGWEDTLAFFAYAKRLTEITFNMSKEFHLNLSDDVRWKQTLEDHIEKAYEKAEIVTTTSRPWV